MKFRLPFQIYRTGVISRSSSPGRILYKFSEDHEDKVRKKASKINSSYRAIISNYIYHFTHLPLKITMSKIRNRTKLRSSTKSRVAKIRNEFVFLQEAAKDNSTQRKAKTDKVTKETSECCMNSTKCANFMCAKTTAKILLQQKDILCNKRSKKSVTNNPEEVKLKEIESIKKLPKSSKVLIKENKGTNNTTPTPVKKTENPAEKQIKEKHEPNDYKWRFKKTETVASNTELKRLKRFLQNSDMNRNYKVEEAPAAPVRMDNIMGTSQFPKKLPELPVQIMPKVEQVRPKEGPSLIAPRRKYDSPEMTRNYKPIEDFCDGPPRMDNIVGCKNDIKDFHVNYSLNLKQSAAIKNNQITEGRKNTNRNSKHYSTQQDLKTINPNEINKRNSMGEEKDAFLLKLDQVINDLVPKVKRPTKSLQQLDAVNINVSEKVKKIEESIKKNTDQHNKSEGLKIGLMEGRQGNQAEKRDHGILAPKLSPFAIAEIRRKYYSPITFEKEKPKISVPNQPQISFAVPLIEKNDYKAETKLNHLYSKPKEPYTNVGKTILDINSNSTKKKFAKSKKTGNSGVDKQKDKLAINVDNNKCNSLGDCSTASMIEPSTINVNMPKVMIPPPSKNATAPENKRNYSSTAIYENKDICTDSLNNPINYIYSNSTATPNLSYNLIPVDKKITNVKQNWEINSDISKPTKRNRIESDITQDLEILRQDRRFSTDVLTKNNEDCYSNTREFISNSNLTTQRNLSKRCTIKVIATSDNQDNQVSQAGSGKLTRKLSYQYYHEQCTVSKNVNDFEIELPTNLNEPNSANIEINANELMSDDIYNKLLNEKTALINNYLKWKMVLKKFGTSKKRSESSKCSMSSLSLTNDFEKQNKYKMRKYKIIQRKKSQKCRSNQFLPVRQEQNDSVNNTINLIKNQVAQKCVLFDKISDALLKKSDLINYSNQTSNYLQLKEKQKEYLQENKKRKSSIIPMLDQPPKKKCIPTPETKNFVEQMEVDGPELQEIHAFIPKKKCIPETKNVIEQMEVDVPQVNAIKSVPTTPLEEDACNLRRPYSRKYSIKIKGPKAPSREGSRLKLIHTNKNYLLQQSIKIKPPAIPATMKAKKFLAKIEAGPDQVENMLIKKIKIQKS